MATAPSSVSSSAVAPERAPAQERPTLPPGPRAPALLQTLAWALAPTWLMDRCAAKLGEAFTLTFAPSGLKLVFISDPSAVKSVFTASPEVAPSAANDSPVAPVLGPSSVLIQTGAEHMRQRKLLLPPFHGERMREYEQVIVQETRRDMTDWPLGSAMRMLPRTRAITLEVILRAVFGVEAERMGPLRAAIGELIAPMHTLTLLRSALSRPGPGRPDGAIGRSLDRLDAVIYGEIATRRAQSDLEDRADILSLLLQARDEQGSEMADSELRDELVTLLLAGHETTATSVAWALERLVRHPDKLARLTAEIDAQESDEYLLAVVNETLRVRPVVPIVVRLLMEDLRVGERVLPRGTRVVPSIYLTNRNARVYGDAREFRPERFLGEAPETFSWIPFGGGIRRCIGASFAQLEMKLMLATMLSERRPRLPSRTVWRRGEWVRRRAITLVPADGARVVWERRGGG
jgi:cytochrome P450 family 135